MMRYLLPLGVFVVLVAFLGIGLTLNPREVPSPLIGKPAPKFSLPSLKEPEKIISLSDVTRQVSLLNVWASWCVACRQEHQLLSALARRDGVTVYGLNYKDTRQDAMRWLAVLGDPYAGIAFDQDGRVGINFGVYGVPETFLVDTQGIIRYKQIGPITEDAWDKTLLPKIRALQSEKKPG